jgi:formyl-CoA transferase
MRMSASPPALDRAPPTLGQHTEEVLRELAGIDDAALAALRARQII